MGMDGTMLDWILGILSFFLFFLYDWNRVFRKNNWMRPWFAMGNLLLAAVAVRMLLKALSENGINGKIWICIGSIFLIILIYTLYFALPFDSTYCQEADGHKVCRTGMYGWCRHPGIWWFLGMFVSFGMAAGGGDALWLGLVLSFLNLLYAWYQDRWIFVLEFSDYEDYRREVPFLIPGRREGGEHT